MKTMWWWIWFAAKAALWIWLVGFVLSLVLHALFLQMVTFSLALLRSAVWPIFLATGWPHGVPLPMD